MFYDKKQKDKAALFSMPKGPARTKEQKRPNPLVQVSTPPAFKAPQQPQESPCLAADTPEARAWIEDALLRHIGALNFLEALVVELKKENDALREALTHKPVDCLLDCPCGRKWEIPTCLLVENLASSLPEAKPQEEDCPPLTEEQEKIVDRLDLFSEESPKKPKRKAKGYFPDPLKEEAPKEDLLNEDPPEETSDGRTEPT